MKSQLPLLSMAVVLSGILALSSQAQSNPIRFYGNNPSATEPGGEYIVFQVSNNIAKGLVYVQNSDVGSCFKGKYNPANNQIEKPLYAYRELGVGKWEFQQSTEALSLKDFPHQLNYSQISPGANNWFQECLKVYK